MKNGIRYWWKWLSLQDLIKKFSKMTKNLQKDCETQEALMSQMYSQMNSLSELTYSSIDYFREWIQKIKSNKK